MHIGNYEVPTPVVNVLQFVRLYPSTAMLCFTGCSLFAMHWAHARRVQSLYESSMHQLQQHVAAAQDEATATLKLVNESWALDLKEKDNVIRKLQLQSVEQTRSVDRLSAAIRNCSQNPFVSVPPSMMSGGTSAAAVATGIATGGESTSAGSNGENNAVGSNGMNGSSSSSSNGKNNSGGRNFEMSD